MGVCLLFLILSVISAVIMLVKLNDFIDFLSGIEFAVIITTLIINIVFFSVGVVSL